MLRSSFLRGSRLVTRPANAAGRPGRCFGVSPKAQQGAQTQQAQATRSKYRLSSQAKPSRYDVEPEQRLDTATAGVQALVRFGSAAFVSPNLSKFPKRPAKPIEMYEFEGCPFCRKVREALTILDIDIHYYPCPKGGPTFRPKAQQMSGKAQFPYMVDPNTGRSMLESDAIINYLFQEYGDGQVPLQFSLGPVTTVTAGLALLPRAGKGTSYRPSRQPEKPIDIWGYEASPFCKITREVLTELEIPHIYHTVARNSPKRQEMTDKWGVFQVPYIEDSNTGIAMFETPQINQYLEKTYGR